MRVFVCSVLFVCSSAKAVKDDVFLEWRELHLNAVQRDYLELKAPTAQLSQALQLACPKALKVPYYLSFVPSCQRSE